DRDRRRREGAADQVGGRIGEAGQAGGRPLQLRVRRADLRAAVRVHLGGGTRGGRAVREGQGHGSRLIGRRPVKFGDCRVGNARAATAHRLGLSSIALVSLLCWTAMLAASDAPIILARETAGTKPPWLAGVQVAALATLLLSTWLSRALAAAR